MTLSQRISQLSFSDWHINPLKKDKKGKKKNEESKGKKWLQQNILDDITYLDSCQNVLNSEERWTTWEIERLHIHLLECSLYDLKMQKKGWDEIARWITTPMKTTPEPFSFQACCWFEGVDPENLIDLLAIINATRTIIAPYLLRVWGMSYATN